MKTIRTILTAAFCVAALAAAQRITCRYDRAMDFTKFHTYQWVTLAKNPRISQATSQNIANLVNTQLALKGLVMVAADPKADLYVGFQASVTGQPQLNWFDSGGSWAPWMASTSTFDNGTLVVEIYNPAQKQLVWRGSAAKTLNPGSNPDSNYQNLRNTIAKLLKDFPPPVGK
jgi:hypothetical protein